MVPTPISEGWDDEAKRHEADIKYFPDMVEYMDMMMGRLLDGIANLGLAEDTLVLFYSDNGTDQKITSEFRGQKVKGGKATPLQTGIMPLIAHWPGTIKAGRLNSNLIDASDFLPTLAELAGIKIPRNWQHDGISFAHQLFGKRGNLRDHCFFWYDPRPGWDKERFRRHIFALDHNYKLFSDGRFYDISGTGLKEVLLDNSNLSTPALLVRE